MNEVKVFIGWDDRESEAFFACMNSLVKNSNRAILPNRLRIDDLHKIYNRNVYFPNEVASTQFSFTRFLVPYLCNYEGWAVFCDCDIIFTRDIRELNKYMDSRYSVLCVKHDYEPKSTVKMDGQVQTKYPKKNWSSVMLINCEHTDCRNLTPSTVSTINGAWLHQMQWTIDDKIGELELEWNWLVGEYDKETLDGKLPAALHYTLGCPFMPGYENCDFADEYRKYVI